MHSTPLIHCVRHAHGYHNLGQEHWGLVDPSLTPLGLKQCHALAESHSLESRISLVVASPLTRTLQTAYLIFGITLASSQCAGEIIALPEAQETSDLVSDTGLDDDLLRSRCDENRWPVDLSLVHDGWNIKTSYRWAPTRQSLRQRAREARQFIWTQIQQLQDRGVQNPEIVLVTHGGFLHYLTEDWQGSGVEKAEMEGRLEKIRWDMPGTAWKNTELRTYQIKPCGNASDPDYQLFEIESSRTRRNETVIPCI